MIFSMMHNNKNSDKVLFGCQGVAVWLLMCYLWFLVCLYVIPCAIGCLLCVFYFLIQNNPSLSFYDILIWHHSLLQCKFMKYFFEVWSLWNIAAHFSLTNRMIWSIIHFCSINVAGLGFVQIMLFVKKYTNNNFY